MKFRVKLYWEMCGEVEVEADSVDQAMQKAIDGPLPESSEYVSDSANVDPIDVTLVNPTVTHPIICQEKLDGIRRIEAIAFQTQPGSCPP
jgi:hypothetical protein